MKRTLLSIAIITAAACAALGAPASPKFIEMSKEQARREAAVLEQSTTAAAWIWSDRYVYQPGQQLTLRGTVRPNNDLYPYTLFAYRINNQTGVRTFLPGGTTTATDMFGQTLDQGFRITRLPELTKGVLVGAGGSVATAPLTIPNELGMHTIVFQLRDYTGTRVVKSAYWKIGVVDGVDDIQGNIDADRTLVNTRAYRIRGVVTVRNNATLTVQPGTFVFGQPGSQPPSVLLVARTGRIAANGTRNRPIIMTSRDIDSPIGSRRRGDWGGIILLGRASGNVPASQSFVEGLNQSDDTQWGGTDDAHNCGSLRYVRVEYAGVQLAPNNETNGFVWAGCGTGTTADHLQAHYGNDDAFEWFGGTANARYLVATYAEDDNFDYQLGWRGSVQYGLVLQNPTDRGNRGVEGDNSEFDQTATPFSNPTFFNITMVGSGATGSSEPNAPGLYLRRGARGSFNNVIVTNFASPGFQADGAPTQANIDDNTLTANGILLWNNGLGSQAPNTVQGQVTTADVTFAQGTRGQGRNFLIADPMLVRPLEFSDPDFRPMFGSPVYRANWIAPPDNGFFDQSANFIGAFGETDWTEEWTNFHQETDVTP